MACIPLVTSYFLECQCIHIQSLAHIHVIHLRPTGTLFTRKSKRSCALAATFGSFLFGSVRKYDEYGCANKSFDEFHSAHILLGVRPISWAMSSVARAAMSDLCSAEASRNALKSAAALVITPSEGRLARLFLSVSLAKILAIHRAFISKHGNGAPTKCWAPQTAIVGMSGTKVHL